MATAATSPDKGKAAAVGDDESAKASASAPAPKAAAKAGAAKPAADTPAVVPEPDPVPDPAAADLAPSQTQAQASAEVAAPAPDDLYPRDASVTNVGAYPLSCMTTGRYIPPHVSSQFALTGREQALELRRVLTAAAAQCHLAGQLVFENFPSE